MFHMQGTADDWPRAVARLPDGCCFKAVDRADLFREAKAVRLMFKTYLETHSQRETGKRLEERGWKRGIGLIYKEKIPFTEILDCIAFIKAYRESYEFLTETGGPFINVPITVESFLELVDVKTKIERECGPLPAEMTWKNLEPFLFRTMGFKLVSFEEENK